VASHRQIPADLCKVAVHGRRTLFVGTFEIFSADEVLDSLLDEPHVWLEASSKLSQDFVDEMCVAQLLSRPSCEQLVCS
jgi:hypothetical protein